MSRLMRQEVVKTNFYDHTDVEMASHGGEIMANMESNAHMAKPDFWQEVEDAWKAYIDAFPIARLGSRIDIARKNAAKQTLADNLQRMGFYVNMKAAGRLSALLSTGYILEKKPEPVELKKPTGLSAKPGDNEGDVC